MFYRVLDSGEFQKLEQIGEFKIVRPAASAIWKKSDPELWQNVDAEFLRSEKGQGKWRLLSQKKFTEIQVTCTGVQLFLRPTPFGHIGLFAEQIDYWQRIIQTLSPYSDEKIKVLNLFAYTGGSTLAAAKAGAEVTHVDASKTSIEWAKQNAELNGLQDASIRWMVDDVMAFVKREIRRGNKYHAIILDPPSYGRGPKNQLWKIEEDLPLLIESIKELLSENFLFLHLSAHTPGVSALTLENLLRTYFSDQQNFITEEMYINVESGPTLPSGTSCWMSRK